METSSRRGRERIWLDGATTARVSTRFHFEHQDHTNRGDHREYSLLLPDETMNSRHFLGMAQAGRKS